MDHYIIIEYYYNQQRKFLHEFEEEQKKYSINYSFYYSECLNKKLTESKLDKKLFLVIGDLIKYGSLIVCRKKEIMSYVFANKQPFLDFSDYYISPIQNSEIKLFNNLEKESKNYTKPEDCILSLSSLNRYSIVDFDALEYKYMDDVYYFDSNCTIKDYLREINLLENTKIKNREINYEILEKMFDNNLLDYKKLNYDNVEFNKYELERKSEVNKDNAIGPLLHFVLNDEKNEDVFDFIKFIALLELYASDPNWNNCHLFKESIFRTQLKIKIPQNSYLYLYLLSFDFSSSLRSVMQELKDWIVFKATGEYPEEEIDYDFDYKWAIEDGLDDLYNADPDWEWNID
jgi:hypothetical protein